jgi:hypothetical protein
MKNDFSIWLPSEKSTIHRSRPGITLEQRPFFSSLLDSSVFSFFLLKRMRSVEKSPRRMRKITDKG